MITKNHAHGVFNLVLRWIFALDLIVNLDDEVAIIPGVRFALERTLD